ncbi:MAG: YitT family protein [Thermodesulfobacteriota bacterium]
MQMSKRVKEKLELKTGQRILRVSIQQVMIVAGALLSALGYAVFQVPHNIAAGGVSGLGIIVNHLTGFPVGMFFLLFNVPLFVLGFFWLGRWRFVWSSIMAVTVFSLGSDFFIHYLPIWVKSYPLTSDGLLAAIYAGVLYGLGTGLIYRYGGTIGGTSITARIIYNVTGYPLSQSYLFTDLAVVLAAGLVFSMEAALLAVITIIMVGIFSDFVLEGSSQMRTLMIVTENPDPIRYAIINELKRGVTEWEVVGGYSKTKRTMLYLTVLRSRIYDVKYIISRIDPDAFMVVGVSQQTWGGFNAPRIDRR